MNTDTKNMVLEGQQAINLWLSGKDKWNKWVELNPVADVSFKQLQGHAPFEKIIHVTQLQGESAPHISVYTSKGVLNLKHFLGRLLSAVSTSFILA